MIRLSCVTLIAALGMAAFNFSARAEDAPATPKAAHKEECKGCPAGNMRERIHAMLFDGITLSDEQKAALAKLKETKTEGPATKEKCLSALRSVLTADQAAVLDANIKKMEEKKAAFEKKIEAAKGKCEGRKCEGRKCEGKKDGASPARPVTGGDLKPV